MEVRNVFMRKNYDVADTEKIPILKHLARKEGPLFH